eukprot:TRINITY_DN5186_c0_g2_i3.p1 TRINITY_DN5186_c0_g2~~TRINITY_DN5186_c0_g2_i3.p1  ORF type:complete len:187 (-),score=16.30 TRINITY_DN5186_c0_g2_i3:14-574(-)
MCLCMYLACVCVITNHVRGSPQSIRAILGHLNLRGIGIVDALRAFMYMFTLPCRARFADTVLGELAEAYCTQNIELGFNLPQDCLSAVFYVLLMLNTDLTSHIIKPSSKMQPDQFINVMAGINNGSDLDTNCLLEWYTDVKNAPICALSDKSLGVPPPFSSGFIYAKYSVSSEFKRQWCEVKEGYL